MSNQYLRKKGFHVGGKASYGYKIKQFGKRRVKKKHKKEQQVIKFIKLCKDSPVKCLFLNQQMKKICKVKAPIECLDVSGKPLEKIHDLLTYREIANMLNAYGVKNRNKSWTKGSVARVYRNNL